MSAEYYNKVLYPLQDRALKIFADTPYQQLSAVNWLAPIDQGEIKSRLQAVALTIAEGG